MQIPEKQGQAAFTEEERALLLGYLMQLRADFISRFLERADLPRTGTRAVLRERVEEALSEGRVTYESIALFLDEFERWGKQHVVLYANPGGYRDQWASEEEVRARLREHELEQLLDAPLPVALPEMMTLSSISFAPGTRLVVTAVERREQVKRREDLDPKDGLEPDEAGGSTIRRIELRAFERVITRGLVVFDWQIDAGTAAIHISQRPTGQRYDTVIADFAGLVDPWLRLDRFAPLDLADAVAALHAHEEEDPDTAETRSHRHAYRTTENRELQISSASAQQSAFGETALDQVASTVRNRGVAQLGNLFFLAVEHPSDERPLVDDVHVTILVADSRVNFMTPQSPDAISYVLGRLRALSG
ncbi:MAG TPA: hypothetical protein VJZ25_00990 [Gemmatimonadaceae bacterium]|nr:hypothetical protein [Gemmatimonadaceae bacterium]